LTLGAPRFDFVMILLILIKSFLMTAAIDKYKIVFPKIDLDHK